MNSGERKPVSEAARSLGSRDRQILDAVVRYRMVTNESIYHRFFLHATPNAVVKVTSRLVRSRWLASHPLYQRRQYFTPGDRLVRQRGLPKSRIQPLGPQTLAAHFAVLRYCGASAATAEAPANELAVTAELRESLPWLPVSFHSRHHVVHRDSQGIRWRLIRTDMGGRADHVVRKIARDIERLHQQPEFVSLINTGRFQQVLLTPSTVKKQLLQRSLAERPWPSGLRFQIGVIPELFQLLGTY